MSIRRNLLVTLLLGLLLVGVAASAATYFAARKEANELFDYQLRQMALSLRDQTLQSRNALFPDFDYDFIVQVWDPVGTRLYFSNQFVALPQGSLGFDSVTVNGGEWRIFTMSDGQKAIQVAQPMSLRRDRAASIALRILVPILASIPLFALLIWLLVGRGLHPLGEIARAIGARAPNSLDPLPDAGLPEEVQPMVGQLNGLLARLSRTIDTLKGFTADAAHELRSPLTALHLQTQLVERARTEVERAAAIEQLRAGARRASRLVEQLLTMARLEPEATEAPAPVALERLAAGVLAELEPLAAEKGIDLRLGRIEPVRVIGRETALRTLVLNLLDNALRYTPAGGRVRLDAYPGEDGLATLAVTDTGPGIPAAERERVFDRFYRLPQPGTTGSGLGLAIARQIAEGHGATIELGEGDDRRGLRATVRLPGVP